MLEDLQVKSISLITNNPKKIEGLVKLGIQVDKRIPIETRIHNDNQDYLKTKVEKMSHIMSMPDSEAK